MGITAREVVHFVRGKSDRKLYVLSEEVAPRADRAWKTRFVVVSRNGKETIIFAANASGEVLDWDAMPGSSPREAIAHEEAIKRAGWKLEPR